MHAAVPGRCPRVLHLQSPELALRQRTVPTTFLPHFLSSIIFAMFRIFSLRHLHLTPESAAHGWRNKSSTCRFEDRQLYAADSIWLLLTLRMIIVLVRDYLKFQARVPMAARRRRRDVETLLFFLLSSLLSAFFSLPPGVSRPVLPAFPRNEGAFAVSRRQAAT